MNELLKAGANCRLQASHGMTVLMYAVLNGSDAILESLCSAAQYQSSSKQESVKLSPSRVSTLSGRSLPVLMKPSQVLTKSSSQVLESSSLPGVSLPSGSTLSASSPLPLPSSLPTPLPLAKSLPTRQLPIVNMQDREGITALMLACKVGASSYVDILLRYGAQAHICSFRGEKALTFALMHDRVHCVEVLVQRCGFIDARSRNHLRGALFTAAELNETGIIRCLVHQPSYIQQFVDEIVQSPSRVEETTVEVALRDEMKQGSEEEKTTVAVLCIKQAYYCLRLLMGVVQGVPLGSQQSLSGVAECAKWCIKLCKVFHEEELECLEPFWICIERMTERQKEVLTPSITTGRSEAESHDEGWGPAILPSSSTRLLLSFIEIYVLGHYNLKVAADIPQKQNGVIQPRLRHFFTVNQVFLKYIF